MTVDVIRHGVPLWAGVARRTAFPQLAKKESGISLGGADCQHRNPLCLQGEGAEFLTEYGHGVRDSFLPPNFFEIDM